MKKHKEVSKYYKNDCIQNVILLFMVLFAAPVIKDSHIWARICFIFQKYFLKQTWKSFNTKFSAQWIDRLKELTSKKKI